MPEVNVSAWLKFKSQGGSATILDGILERHKTPKSLTSKLLSSFSAHQNT